MRRSSTPKARRLLVWALPSSLAATGGISFDYFSSDYLDVSVHRVCLPFGWHDMTHAGLPHSEIRGSLPACGFPRLFAACRVLLRLETPRHPPYALCSLTCFPAGRIFAPSFVASQSGSVGVALLRVPLHIGSLLARHKASARLSLHFRHLGHPFCLQMSMLVGLNPKMFVSTSCLHCYM